MFRRLKNIEIILTKTYTQESVKNWVVERKRMYQTVHKNSDDINRLLGTGFKYVDGPGQPSVVGLCGGQPYPRIQKK